MATKDSGKRGPKEQAPRRRTGQPAQDTSAREPVPTPTPTPSVGPTPQEAGSRRRTRATSAPEAAESQTSPARRRKPRPEATGAALAPQEAPETKDKGKNKGKGGPAGEEAARQPLPVTEAPEAAATGSAEPMIATLPGESLPPTSMPSEVHGYGLPPTAPPPPEGTMPPPAPNVVLAEAVQEEERAAALAAVPALARGGRRDRARVSHSNALGMLIERHFGDPMSPCRSYSDLERRSGISREALSRYVTSRTDRRRSPTIDTLVAIADAMHLSLESVCRAAAASVKGMPLAPDEEQHAREEVLSALVAGLTDQQFSAVVELLRHLRPVVSASDH